MNKEQLEKELNIKADNFQDEVVLLNAAIKSYQLFPDLSTTDRRYLMAGFKFNHKVDNRIGNILCHLPEEKRKEQIADLADIMGETTFLRKREKTLFALGTDFYEREKSPKKRAKVYTK